MRDAVALFELLLVAAAQRDQRDLLEVAVVGEDQLGVVVLHKVVRRGDLDLVVADELGLARFRVLFLDFGELFYDLGLDPEVVADGRLEVGDLGLEVLDLLDALHDVLAVEVAQLDLGDVLGLNLVEVEGLHQVGYDLALLGRAAHDRNGAVDVEQNLAEAEQQMQLFLLFAEVEAELAAQAAHAEADPFAQDVRNAELARRAVDQHVEVAVECVLQRRQLVELGHQLVGVGAAAQVDGQLEAREVDLVAHVGDVLDLAALDRVGDLGDDCLNRGGVGDLRHVDAVGVFIVGIARAHPQGAAPGLKHAAHGLAVVDDVCAAGEVGRLDDVHQRVRGGVRMAEQGNRRVADLAEVERADGGGHADGNAHVGRDQNVGKRGR